MHGSTVCAWHGKQILKTPDESSLMQGAHACVVSLPGDALHHNASRRTQHVHAA
jgi:hypothetical protein